MGFDRILGEKCKLFRPPHGIVTSCLIPAWAVGQQVVMWNVDLVTTAQLREMWRRSWLDQLRI
jgi:hypothetical protein